MTIESPKQKRGGTNKKNRSAAAQTKKTEARRHKQKKQKRGGTSRPKDNFIIPPPDSAACAARLVLILSRGSACVNVSGRDDNFLYPCRSLPRTSIRGCGAGVTGFSFHCLFKRQYVLLQALKISPVRFERTTFGSGGQRSVH